MLLINQPAILSPNHRHIRFLVEGAFYPDHRAALRSVEKLPWVLGVILLDVINGLIHQGETDLWRAQRLADGSFGEPVNLGPPVNSEHSEVDTYVAPDESWMVVTSRRPGGIGGGDLYVSFRQGDGAWGEPQLLPPTINSDLLDYCPMGTPDGRYLFFSRRTGDSWDEADAGDVFWVDAAAIEKMRP